MCDTHQITTVHCLLVFILMSVYVLVQLEIRAPKQRRDPILRVRSKYIRTLDLQNATPGQVDVVSVAIIGGASFACV
jgi:hypothetical protein